MLGFLLMAWISVVALLVLAPEVYDRALQITPADGRSEQLSFLFGLSAFLLLLTIGVLRRWRWAFWLIMVAFLASILRVPASILQITGRLPTDLPTWYVAFQGLLGLTQLAIGLAMISGYRRAGAWGSF